MDKNLRRLDIDSYGVSDTSLEEVFLRVTAHSKQGEGAAPAAVTSPANYDVFRTKSSEPNKKLQRMRRFARSEKAGARRAARSRRERRRAEDESRDDRPYVTDSFGRELIPDPVNRSNLRSLRVCKCVMIFVSIEVRAGKSNDQCIFRQRQISADSTSGTRNGFQRQISHQVGPTCRVLLFLPKRGSVLDSPSSLPRCSSPQMRPVTSLRVAPTSSFSRSVSVDPSDVSSSTNSVFSSFDDTDHGS